MFYVLAASFDLYLVISIYVEFGENTRIRNYIFFHSVKRSLQIKANEKNVSSQLDWFLLTPLFIVLNVIFFFSVVSPAIHSVASSLNTQNI